MIRYIYIGNQITEGADDFAWFDTVRDIFQVFNGEQVWSEWEDFVKDYVFHFESTDGISRYKGLFPTVILIQEFDPNLTGKAYREHIKRIERSMVIK